MENKNVHHEPKRIVLWILLAILAAAFLLRAWNIENIPYGIYPDEAQNGVDAQAANKTGEYKLFYETNQGREGLFINIQALSIKYLGNTVFALKFPSIIFGTLTVLGVFLLTYEIFQSYIAGLVGAYFITFSYWAINFSRIGFRAIMVPMILTFTFYFILRGIRTKKFHDFIIGGLIYGLGVHTYIAFRVSPIVLMLLLIFLVLACKKFLREYWKHVVAFAIAMFVTAMPMLLDFFYFHPEHYASRTSVISILNPEVNKGLLLPLLAKTIILSIQKYFLVGDFNMRHNYPPYPLLNPIVGISFLVGLIYVAIRFIKLAFQRFKKGKRSKDLYIFCMLLFWFLALLIPEFLAYEGNPHALRAIGTLPVVMIIAVYPFMWIINKYHSFGNSFKMYVLSLMGIAFLFIAVADPLKYFVFFANNPKQHQSFEGNLKEVSDYLKKLPPAQEKFVIARSMQRLPIDYLNANMPGIFYMYPDEAGSIFPNEKKNFSIIFTGADWDIINAQRSRFPGIKFEEHKNRFGDAFYVLKY